MAQLTPFTDISNKITNKEFVSSYILEELQHLTSPGNTILTFVDQQGNQFHVLAKI